MAVPASVLAEEAAAVHAVAVAVAALLAAGTVLVLAAIPEEARCALGQAVGEGGDWVHGADLRKIPDVEGGRQSEPGAAAAAETRLSSAEVRLTGVAAVAIRRLEVEGAPNRSGNRFGSEAVVAAVRRAPHGTSSGQRPGAKVEGGGRCWRRQEGEGSGREVQCWTVWVAAVEGASRLLVSVLADGCLGCDPGRAAEAVRAVVSGCGFGFGWQVLEAAVFLAVER